MDNRAFERLGAEDTRPSMKKILLAQPRGFCAGVERAVDIIDELLSNTRETIYVRKEIVHNRHVIERLRSRGAIFVEELDEVPEGSLLVYSAHGVSPAVRENARLRKLRTIDATCPLVTKVHREVLSFVSAGCRIILIGHEGHEEVEGTMGYAADAVTLVQNESDARMLRHEGPQPLGIVSQTTLAASEVERIIAIITERFPDVRLPRKSDICYATENRQNAVQALASQCQSVIVVGSNNSSNSRSLRDVVQSHNVSGFLVDDPLQIESQWLQGVTTLGLTAGASSPDSLVQAVIERVRYLDPEFSTIETFGTPEPAMTFRHPPELREILASASLARTVEPAG